MTNPKVLHIRINQPFTVSGRNHITARVIIPLPTPCETLVNGQEVIIKHKFGEVSLTPDKFSELLQSGVIEAI